MTSLDPGSTGRAFAQPAAPAALLTARFWAAVLTVALLLCGFVARVTPLFDQRGRLLRQFPTEDGYLMLTIARNIGLGLGMSTAAGTIPTNGTQPLCPLLWAAGYWAVGGDKVAGVLLVLVYSLVISLVATYALFALGRRLLGHHSRGESIAALAAAAWFGSPLSVKHSMNCLETGTFALALILVIHAFINSGTQARWSPARCVALGALLGLAFWVRNDAVLLIVAACLTRVCLGLRQGRALVARRFAETVLLGITSALVASPWLIYNRLNFGSIVPISGLAESLHVRLGSNLVQLPAALIQYLLVPVQVPRELETNRTVIMMGIVLIVGAGTGLAFIWVRTNARLRVLITLGTTYAVFLCAFYGLYFGAGHFMSRYLYPLSPLVALLWAGAMWQTANWLCWRRVAPLTVVGALAVFALALGLNYRIYRKGLSHLHFQMVEWVEANVPESTWVGAIQSGTLGYFHDRTINLDGKVNPEALAAVRDGRGPQYVLDTHVRYLVDWVGIARWAALPALRPHFVIEVEDHDRNLGVLRRVSAPTAIPVGPDFPDAVLVNGTVCACFSCNPEVFGQFGRSTRWVTGENEHFACNSTASSDSNSTGRESPVMLGSFPFVRWTKRSV